MTRYQRDETLGETEKRLRSFAAGLWTTVGFAGVALALATYGIIKGFGRYRERTQEESIAENKVEEGAGSEDRSHALRRQEGTGSPNDAR
jgi:hypothetical protein